MKMIWDNIKNAFRQFANTYVNCMKAYEDAFLKSGYGI